ncbi:DegS, partial [Pasteurella multocida subsp. multocida str. Anand1_cattle]
MEKGILITNVNPEGPAGKAGVKAGDIILKVGDVDAISPAQMMQVIS